MIRDLPLLPPQHTHSTPGAPRSLLLITRRRDCLKGTEDLSELALGNPTLKSFNIQYAFKPKPTTKTGENSTGRIHGVNCIAIHLDRPWFIFLASREKFAGIHNAGYVGASSRHIALRLAPPAPPGRRPRGKGYLQLRLMRPHYRFLPLRRLHISA